jgi:hypothetical protein
VICRDSTATRSVFLDCQQPLALPRLNGPLTRETNPPDDLLAHALRLTGIEFRMLNTSSVSMPSDVYNIDFVPHACTQSRQVTSAQVPKCYQLADIDVKKIAATRMIVQCSSLQCARPAVALSLLLIAGMCKPSLAWAATAVPRAAAPYLPSVAPCPVRPVQR